MGKEHEDGSRSYFNTSHVSINLSLYPIHVYVHHDFNTSHVSINLYSPSFTIDCEIISIHLMFLLIPPLSAITSDTACYFNTSHVSINQRIFGKEQTDCRISIHLMFLLILDRIMATLKVGNFNTSHVSINRIHWTHLWK